MECHLKSSEFGTPLKLRTFIAGRNRLEFKSTTALAIAFKVFNLVLNNKIFFSKLVLWKKL